MIITIPDYRTKSRNKTITGHWRTYQRYRDEIARLIWAYAKDRTFVPHARVTITAYFHGKVAIDTSNIDDKLIIDGLMKAKILPDDAPHDNPEVIKRSIPESKKDELVIEVESC